MKRPAIMEYEDYRSFLRDWYAWMKGTRPGFSYRAFSQWAGFTSPNQLQLIIQGKRNITSATLPVFAKILKLPRRERKYFELLVHLNQAKGPAEKAGCLAEISDLFRQHGDAIRHHQLEYLLRWYYPVLRELVTTKGFVADRHALARRIGHGITPRHIDEAIDQLLALGLLVRKKDGGLEQERAIVTTGAETEAAASYFYHDQMLKLAQDALKAQSPDERNFTGITLACRKEDVAEISGILTDCRRQVLAYLENRGAGEDDEVYQMNLQFFRVTRKRGEA